MIDVTQEILLLRKLLSDCRPALDELAYRNDCSNRYYRDFEMACWQMVLERSVVRDHPEVEGVLYYSSSPRAIYSDARITHKLVCLPNNTQKVWYSLNDFTWCSLEESRLRFWTEKTLDQFLFVSFGTYVLKSPGYKLFSNWETPLDCFLFFAHNLRGVAKVEECTFYLREVKEELQEPEEKKKIFEENKKRRAEIRALWEETIESVQSRFQNSEEEKR